MQKPADAARPRGFHKKGAKVTSIPGTKPSIHNSTLLVSTGVPSLDALLGGGIAVGSCILVDEDRYSTYSSLLLKYYVAEGVTNKHKVLLASANQNPSQILQDLPQPITHDPTANTTPAASTAAKDATQGDELPIAWRYRNVPTTQQMSSTYGNYYDITKVMSKELLSSADTVLFDGSDSSNTHHLYFDLLHKIQDAIESSKLSTSEKSPSNNILRIAIASLGSPFWSENERSMVRFLFALRALLRRSYATCLVTVPGHLLHDVLPIVRASDCAIQLVSFSDNPNKYSKNPAFKEFHGLVNILKLPCINSLTAHLPDTMDWVFKLKRKKLTIEKMHLPPDLSETVSRSQEDAIKPASSCGQTTTGVKVDF